MQTRVSTKGQVVLPGPVRRRLGIQPGDPLDVRIENDLIVLAPRRKHALTPKIVDDPILGIPVLTFGPNAPTLTSKQVEDLLAELP
jgi:AbrB family looped-hinge helix DNA binding protein